MLLLCLRFTLLVLVVSVVSKVSGDRVLHRLDNATHFSPNKRGVLRPMPPGRLNSNGASPAHLLQLSGSPAERGYAHGYLLAPQIIDWFIFYQFRQNMHGSREWYEKISNWWMHNQFRPHSYIEEVDSMLDGMKDASLKFGISMYVPELGRNFSTTEIFMINSYLEATPNNSAITVGPFVGGKADAPACSQFVTWGSATQGGLPLAGRNMDGECDSPHYATVNHLIVFAVAGDHEKRFVSIMWPGINGVGVHHRLFVNVGPSLFFLNYTHTQLTQQPTLHTYILGHVGGLSLFNEDGLYLMLNCGSMGPPGQKQCQKRRPKLRYESRKQLS